MTFSLKLTIISLVILIITMKVKSTWHSIYREGLPTAARNPKLEPWKAKPEYG